MKVFLSYALSPVESALASRLRAVALAYNVELVLPSIDNSQHLSAENKRKIKQSDAVIVLVTNNGQRIEAVNKELIEAIAQNKPIIALVENLNQVKNIPGNQVIVFNRHNPTQHENQLFEALKQIKFQKNTSDVIVAVGAIGMVALGFLALSELTRETNGAK